MLPPIHPICRLFPILSDSELEGMVVMPLLEWEAKERQRLHSSPEGKVAQKCATLLPGGADERGRAVEHGARPVGASPRYIQAAKRIQSACPELLPHVMLGKINMIDAQMAVNLSARFARKY